MKNLYPRIVLDFDSDSESLKHSFCIDALNRIFNHMLPPSFFEGEGATFHFNKQLPMICWTPVDKPPFNISFFICCYFKPHAFRFFYEMISRWLIPGRRLNTILQFSVDFFMPDVSNHKYIGGEVTARIENSRDLEILQKNLPIIENEIRIGLESYYQACRIIEIKGIASDEKTALIQENIVSLINHRPQDFDYDILSEMQHFLVLCKESFKQERSYRHMSRIIAIHYLFRKALKLSLESFPDRRYISVKLVRAKLQKRGFVLGISLALSYIRNNEIFESEHILRGVQAIVPGVEKVEGSFFVNQGRSDPICTMYLEIEKEGGISLEDERLLKEKLPDELQNRFEQRLHPIFMPHNEESLVRNIVTLSHQLRFVRDLPQVIIEFHQQTEEQLEFLVIVLRVVRSPHVSIDEYFGRKPTFLEYIPNRKKIVGKLRKKYPKEASIFYIRTQKLPFLRKNHSVNLYKARNVVVAELTRLIGEFRDYNGGTLSKETELFSSLKSVVGAKAKEHVFLLENLFYSLTPPIMRSILPVEPIQKMFNMILEEKLLDDQPYVMRIQENDFYLYMLITSTDPHFHEEFPLDSLEGEFVTCFVRQSANYHFGLIYNNPSTSDSLKIRLALEEMMVSTVS